MMAQTMSGRSTAVRWLPVLLGSILLAFALRVYHLDAMSFWSDEGISVIRARVEFPQVLNVLPVEHTPLYFVALHQWMHAAGEGDFAVRFFSLFFSVLSVPLVYKLGEVLDRRQQANDERPAQTTLRRPASTLGLLAALLCAINPLQVWYAQEARMYSLVVALCAGAAWCLLRGFQTHAANQVTDRRWSYVNAYWLAFAFLSAAALYTHYFAALVIAAFALWAAVMLWRRAVDWRPLFLSFGLIALLFVPWLPRAMAALSFPGWQAAADPLSLPGRYLVAYTLGTTVPDEWTWLALAFLPLLIMGTLAFVRRRQGVAWLPVAYAFVPFVLLMLLALRKPGYHERYLIVITPMFFVLLAEGLNQIRHAYSVMRNRPYVQHSGLRRFTASYQCRAAGSRITHHVLPISYVIAFAFVLIVSAFALNNLYFDARFAKPDFRGAAQYVDQLSRQGDGLIFDGPDPFKAFYRYFSRKRVSAFDDFSFDPQDETEAATFLSRQLPEHERWWVVLYFHPPGPTEDFLAQHGYETSSRWFNGIRVLLYATPSEAALRTSAPESVQTALPLNIVDVRTLPAVQPGDVLPVVVRWQVTGALPADYQVSMRLLDAKGNRLKQLDRRPLDGRVPTSQWNIGDVIEDRYGLLVPDDAAAGTYQIELLLYPLGGTDVMRARLAPVSITGKE